MLRPDVVEAVNAGEFHIYGVETVDDAIELVSDLPAGQRDEQGRYAEGSFNCKVAASLEAFAQKRKEFGAGRAGGELSRT